MSSTKYGGCLYAKSSDLSIKNSFFDTCRVIGTRQDELYGNIVYLQESSGSVVSADQISQTICGLERNDGDSSIVLSSVQFEVKNVNSSHNRGYGGAALFNGVKSKEGSFIKFCQDSNSYTCTVIESATNSYSCYYTNFLHTKQLTSTIIWTSVTANISLRYCVFYDSFRILCVLPLEFIECQSDSSFQTNVSFSPFDHINEIIEINPYCALKKTIFCKQFLFKNVVFFLVISLV